MSTKKQSESKINQLDQILAELELLRNAEIQTILRKIAEAAALSSSLEELYQAVHRLVRRIFPTKNIQISLLDTDSGQMKMSYYVDETGFIPPQRATGKYMSEYVMRKRCSVHVNAAGFEQLRQSGEVDSRLVPFEEWIGAPLLDAKGDAFGVIALLTLAGEPKFQAEDAGFLSIIAVQIAMAISRKRTEEALRQSEAQFRQLVQRLPVPLLYAHKENSTIKYINDRFVQMIGYTLAEMPTVLEWWQLAYPDGKYRREMMNLWELALESAIRENTDIKATESRVMCKDGKQRIFMITGIVMGDYFLVTFGDITELRRNERLLVDSYERRKKSELLNELIKHPGPAKQAVASCARMLRIKMAESFACYLLVMNSYHGRPREYWLERQDNYQQLIDMLMDELTDDRCIAWESPDGLGVICFGDFTATAGRMVQLGQIKRIRQAVAVRAADCDVCLGISSPAAGLAEIGAHYRQTVVAVCTGKKMWPERRDYYYADLGVLQVLPYINNQKEIYAYIERTLGKLLRHGSGRVARYLETLEVILMSDNLKESAGMLSIHYKTLMFRKRRLESILEVSLDNFNSRMAVATAIQLLKLYPEQEK